MSIAMIINMTYNSLNLMHSKWHYKLLYTLNFRSSGNLKPKEKMKGAGKKSRLESLALFN